MNAEKPHAPATTRNRDAILKVLTLEFAASASVLEIGSGTGQHAVHFARALSHLNWHTSDRLQYHDGISAWIDDSGLSNVMAPVELDVLTSPEPEFAFDAVFSANTAHIMGIDAVQAMFGLVGRRMSPGGVFCLYGPFNENDQFTSSSNEEFHRSLQLQDPAMGIRDLEYLDELATQVQLRNIRQYEMPANNRIIVWGK